MADRLDKIVGSVQVGAERLNVIETVKGEYALRIQQRDNSVIEPSFRSGKPSDVVAYGYLKLLGYA